MGNALRAAIHESEASAALSDLGVTGRPSVVGEWLADTQWPGEEPKDPAVRGGLSFSN